jgi:hypothetical protein
MEPVTKLPDILGMDAKESWQNYSRATDIWVQLDWSDSKLSPSPAERYRIYFLKEIAKLSLAVHFERIEQELW